MKEGVVPEHLVVVSGCRGCLVDVVHRQGVSGARDGQVGREGIVTRGLHVCVFIYDHLTTRGTLLAMKLVLEMRNNQIGRW